MSTNTSGALAWFPGRRSLISGLFLALWIGVAFCTTTQSQSPNEYQVKAAFILNFARFVDWPGDAFADGGSLVVGVVGDDPFGGALDQLSGNSIEGRRLVIRRLKSTDNLRACQILFVSSSERSRLGKIMESVKGASVLTIGDLPQFNQMGGVIKFVVQDNRVRFEINGAAAAQARLRISSKLLALSKGGR
jgi:YfiR/HmsC-like